jgi:hypothetical protein
MARQQPTAWNREDRDLLIELKTQMFSMSGEISAARVEIKEINTGITARLLNLEANALSKIEVLPTLEKYDGRLSDLEDDRIAFKAQVKTWAAVGAFVFALVQLAVSIYFN